MSYIQNVLIQFMKCVKKYTKNGMLADINIIKPYQDPMHL